jgi:hypothetical protein
MLQAVVEFYQGAGLADKTVARRVILHGLAVRRVVRTTGVIARSTIVSSTIVRCCSDGASRADHGGTGNASAVHCPPRVSTRNTRNVYGDQWATDPCLGALD